MDDANSLPNDLTQCHQLLFAAHKQSVELEQQAAEAKQHAAASEQQRLRRRAFRHNLTTGPTVTSKAPSVSHDKTSERERTNSSSPLTLAGRSGPDNWHNRINSLSGS